KQSPMYATYARVAPRPGDWPVLHAKMGELLSADYDWSSEVAAITAPTRLVYADSDSIRPAHRWSSSRCSAAACGTRTGTARAGLGGAWRSCRAPRTTTSSPRPRWRHRSSTSLRRPRRAYDLTGPGAPSVEARWRAGRDRRPVRLALTGAEQRRTSPQCPL